MAFTRCSGAWLRTGVMGRCTAGLVASSCHDRARPQRHDHAGLMPTRAPHPCAHPGCPALVYTTRCEAHERAKVQRHQREDRDQRGTARQRGYDHRWEKLRAWHIARHPLCEDCLLEGNVTAVDDVDHVVPFTSRNDPRRLDPTNLRSLCRPHHNRKTAAQA